MENDSSVGAASGRESEERHVASNCRWNAMSSMHGHAPFAKLGEIFAIAQRDFGFSGTIEDAAELLSLMPRVTVVQAAEFEQYQIGSDAWRGSR